MRTLILWILHITSLLSTFIMWWGILSFVIIEILDKTLCSIPFIRKVLNKRSFKYFCVVMVFFVLAYCCRVSSPYQGLIYGQIE